MEKLMENYIKVENDRAVANDNLAAANETLVLMNNEMLKLRGQLEEYESATIIEPKV